MINHILGAVSQRAAVLLKPRSLTSVAAMRYTAELLQRLHGNALIVAVLVLGLLLQVRVVGGTGSNLKDEPGLTTDRACANATVAASSSSSSRSSWCAPDLPFPFASSVECAASPDFVLQNYCTASFSNRSQQVAPVWENFSHVQQGLSRPPNIMGMGLFRDDNNYNVTLVNLTWESDQFKHPSSACRRPHPFSHLSQYFPTFINLSGLRPNELDPGYETMPLVFSNNNLFLLFNCTSKSIVNTDDKPIYKTNSTGTSYQWEARRSNTFCAQYLDEILCKLNLTELFDETPSCYQLRMAESEFTLPTQLSLQEVMDEMLCTHFEVFVVSSRGPDDAMAVSEWRPGLLQLQWQDVACDGCHLSGGVCVYARDRSYYGCKCSQHGRSRIVSGDCYLDCWEVGAIEICSFAIQMVLVIGGISIGCLLFLVGVCCCAYRCGKRSMKNRRLKRRALWERQHSVNGANDDSMVSELVDLRGLAERPMEFSYKSIESATNSFSSLVGKGGFGVVFKGALAASRNKGNDQEQYASTCKEIAVKVLDVRSHHSKKQFLNEVAIIGRVHHINVVRLLGFCVHDEHEMLVYEYVSNGSLDQWLFDKQNSRDNMTMMLDWRQRYSIAVGIARGLSYLHEECRHRIVHCDIKPQNILLDGQMCPKIADFGLARLINRGESRVVTFAKGTPGYMAPELWIGGDIQLTTKADVYSFGMVLLELVSGRQNFALGLPHFPAVAFDTAINKGSLDSLLDGRLTSAHCESEQNVSPDSQQQTQSMQHEQQQIRTAVLVALWCIQESPASRPCMSAVVQFLEGVAAVSEQLPACGFACSVQLEGQHINSCALSSTDLTPR